MTQFMFSCMQGEMLCICLKKKQTKCLIIAELFRHTGSILSLHEQSLNMKKEHVPLPPYFVLPHFEGKADFANPQLGR